MVPVIEVVKLSYNSTALGKKYNKGNTIKVFGPWEYSTNQIPGFTVPTTSSRPSTNLTGFSFTCMRSP